MDAGSVLLVLLLACASCEAVVIGALLLMRRISNKETVQQIIIGDQQARRAGEHGAQPCSGVYVDPPPPTVPEVQRTRSFRNDRERFFHTGKILLAGTRAHWHIKRNCAGLNGVKKWANGERMLDEIEPCRHCAA